MDNNTVQELEAAIQVLDAAAAAPLAAGHFLLPLPPTHVLLYEGNTLNLSSQTSTSLFQNSCAVLASKFTGKGGDLHLFLADIHNCVQTC